jgi:hypothetical protein
VSRINRDLHRLGALEPLGNELAGRVRGTERVGDLLGYLSVSEWVELGYTVLHMAGEREFVPVGSEELIERMRRRALLRREYGIPVDLMCASSPPTPGCNCLIFGLDTWEGEADAAA